MRNIICTWFLMCLWGDDSIYESASLEHFCTNSKWFHLLCIFSTLTGCGQTTCTFQGPSYLCVFPTLQLAGENNCSQDFEQGEPFFHQLYLVKFQYHSSGFPWKQYSCWVRAFTYFHYHVCSLEALPYTLVLWDAAGLFCIFPAPVLELSTPSRSPGFFF